MKSNGMFDSELGDYIANSGIDDNYDKPASETKYCAQCGNAIEGNYYMVGDNFLQIRYFDDNKSNVFCSTECLCKSLSVLEVDESGNTYDLC